MTYYLPTTVKLLEAYEDLDAQPIQGANILSSKQEIEKTLDTLNTAFEKLLDSLEFYGKADFGSYVDRAVQKILTDPNADPEKEFADAQKLCETEALESFNEANKK